MRKYLIAGVSVFALSASGAMAQTFDETGVIFQGGDNGAAYIDQASNNAPGADALIEQGINSDGDTAAIYQEDGGDIGAVILQNLGAGGGGNLAGIVQTEGSDTGGASVPEAIITQEGNNNSGGIRQRGNGLIADIDQVGDANQAVVKQGDVPPGFGTLNNDTAPSINFASIDDATSWTAPATGLNFNSSSVPAIGSSSTFVFGGQQFDATNSSGTVTQDGNSNQGAVLQDGDGQIGTINQIGNENEAFVYQTGLTNTSTVDQIGNGNFALTAQEGELNVADVNQSGNNDAALILQLGTAFNNDATINQGPDGIVSGGAIVQLGDNNSALINQ